MAAFPGQQQFMVQPQPQQTSVVDRAVQNLQSVLNPTSMVQQNPFIPANIPLANQGQFNQNISPVQQAQTIQPPRLPGATGQQGPQQLPQPFDFNQPFRRGKVGAPFGTPQGQAPSTRSSRPTPAAATPAGLTGRNTGQNRDLAGQIDPGTLNSLREVFGVNL